jgi:hypothetical protein
VNLAFVSSATNSLGDAGNITVNASAIFMDGAGSVREFTGIGANTEADPGTPGGAGGSVTVNADSIHIREGAGIAAKTFSAETGGDVRLDLTGDLLIEASGRAGDQVITGVTAEAGPSEVELNQLGPDDPIPLANGGRIEIRARRVELRGGEVNASATLTGGNVDIRVAESVRLTDARIIAAAPLEELEGRIGDDEQLSGGNVTVDARSVLLSRGVLSANAREIGGVITINPGAAFFPSADPETGVTASGGLAPGTVTTPAPDTDVAARLLRLPGALADDAARLQALCGMRLGGRTSSFVVTGRGGAPIEPGGFQPALAPVAGRRRAAPVTAATPARSVAARPSEK